MCGVFEATIDTGSLLIGRLPDCDIVLGDELVSRMHGRIVVATEGAYVEDLHSTNGVYLNGRRISHTARLHTGDRILIGTSEISVFQGVGSGTTVESSVSRHPLAGQELPKMSQAMIDGASAVAMPPTARADALNLVGSLARRLASEGKVEDAMNVLRPHLRTILLGAHSGLDVSAALCTRAAQLAVDMAHWTAQSVWLDYVIELHLAAKQVMSHPVILALQRSGRWLGQMDRVLAGYYLESFDGPSENLTPDETMRLALVRRALLG